MKNPFLTMQDVPRQFQACVEYPNSDTTKMEIEAIEYASSDWGVSFDEAVQSIVRGYTVNATEKDNRIYDSWEYMLSKLSA